MKPPIPQYHIPADMARIPSEADLTFSTTDGLTYRRKLFGSESVFAYESQSSGQFFGYVGASVVFPRPFFEEDVHRRVTIAWIRLRRTVPNIGMGCRASINDPRDFSFEYQVPRNTAEVEQWAKNTIVWETCQTTFLERQNQMNNEFWDATSGACVSRLVIGRRSDTEYDLFIHGMHAASDGRKTLQVFDLFLNYLDDALRSSNTPMLEELLWGGEVTKLAPAAALLAARIVNGMPVTAGTGTDPENKNEPILFKRASPGNPMHKSAHVCHVQDITLSEVDTSRLRAACRLQKVSVTGFLLAAICLSEVEQSLGSPGKIENAALLNLKQYKDSGVHYELVNAYDARDDLGLHTHGPVGTPTVAVKVASTFVPMNLIQGALLFDENSFSTIRSGPGFWRLAEYTKEQVQIEARTGIRGFLARECRTESSLRGEVFVPWSEAMSGSTLTSIGDLRLLGTLHRWWTDPANEGGHIRIQDIGASTRTLRAMKGHMSWQFKGRLTIRVRTGGKWTSFAQLEEYNKVLKSWIDDILKDE